MIIPVESPQLAKVLATRVLLPCAVLWAAFSSLMWLPAAASTPVVSGVCQALGIAQLFGGLLMLSPCTYRTALIWTVSAFALTAVTALATLQLGTLAFAAIVASCAAYSLSADIQGPTRKT